MSYIPSREILEKYADVLINFALNSGEGVQKGEVVWLRIDEPAKPLLAPLRNAVLRAGGIPLIQFIPSGIDAGDEYEISTDEQLSFFMRDYYEGLIKQVDHMVYILAEDDKYALQNTDPKKIMIKSNALRPYMEMRNKKEAEGKFTWTIAMYGTKHMADDVSLSEEEYWEQIIKACYLDSENPIEQWKQTFSELNRIQKSLNALSIEKVHVVSEDINLFVGIGANRKWLGGMGRNIPSFELFISPNCFQTEGKVHFNQPLYRYGNLIEDVELEFKNGIVVSAQAKKGEAVLKEMIASENADMIGEFSLTDGRFSRITKVMGETLYDENIGGEQGNTHIALGNAYQDSYTGDPSRVTNDQWKEWGFNQSPVHTDIVSTTKRTVTAFLSDGTEKIIYTDGRFTL